MLLEVDSLVGLVDKVYTLPLLYEKAKLSFGS